jgi:hypothetical protein
MMAEMSSRRAAWTLFLLGFLTLFVELVLIRYLAGSVWNLGYFPNFVLIAVFVGAGVGFICHPFIPERLSPWLFQAAAFALMTLVVVLTFKRPIVPGFGNWEASIGGELYFTAAPADSAGGAWLFVVVFLMVVVSSGLVAQRAAKLFRALSPLHAYTMDIAGSLAGIVAFMILSWLESPPALWFLLLAIPFVVASGARSYWRLLPMVPLVVSAALVIRQDAQLMSNPGYEGELEVSWSPYQKVEYVNSLKVPDLIFVNGIAHQTMYPLPVMRKAFYQVPWDLRAKANLPPYKNVLIIGAGSGNDVAIALANGAEHVDAAEIDPVIARLGREHHPAHPYDDPRVTLLVDDARSVMTNTEHKYDLIVFALTDSLVKVSSLSQLRLENYLFTEESVHRAWDLLADRGDIVLYNYYRRPWLVEKFQRMVHAGTGRYPIDAYERGDFHHHVDGTLHSADTAPVYHYDDLPTPTDDWPFPYLEWRGLPALYITAMIGLAFVVGLLMVVLEWATRRKTTERQPPRVLLLKLAFVGMGIAFLLLETKSIVQFSLLFGTTWKNTSLVFMAVLVMVLAANWVARAMRSRWVIPAAYGLLVASCLLTLVYPLANLLSVESNALRFAIASLMTFSPIFFANVIFSVSFRDQEIPEQLFGWNLLGATIGGVIEYASMATGYNFLAVIVACCYTVVFALLVLYRRRSEA